MGHAAILGWPSDAGGTRERACWSRARRAGSAARSPRRSRWRGATLGLVARSEDELRELADELPGDDHKILIADVADRGQIGAAIEAFGDIDVLVANAGVARYLQLRRPAARTKPSG